jgi:endonuclease/exonuclease/phosphatase (EEP) superfamily protein YafD
MGTLWAVVACTEWEPAFWQDQLAQTDALLRLLTSDNLNGRLPVILAADLNAPPEAPKIKRMTDVLTDTWVEGKGEGNGITLSSDNPFAPLGARDQIDRRIDYILARMGSPEAGLEVTKVFIEEARMGGQPLSDHYAVVADLSF